MRSSLLHDPAKRDEHQHGGFDPLLARTRQRSWTSVVNVYAHIGAKANALRSKLNE
jgi:hypothetical protein